MKAVIIFIILIHSCVLHAEAWGPQDIEFTLEGQNGINVMLWLSGFSYAASDARHKLGCKEGIDQFFLIQTLNKKYSGMDITAQQATTYLSKKIETSYSCNSKNKRPQ